MFLDLRRSAIRLAALLLAPLPVALGQVPDAGDRGIRVFEPVYFMEFDPLTALDMVNRLPGVSPQESDGGRGLSGVKSNLLINGERPPPKGKSAREQLDEMPVDDVVAIELIDTGARLDVDMQGYPQVINVVTQKSRRAYYDVSTELQHSGSGDMDQENESVSQVDGTGSFSWGEHEFTVTGNLQDRSTRSPASLISIDPANPVQRLSSLTDSDRKEEGIQLDGSFALPGDSTLNFNSQFTKNTRGSMPLSLTSDLESEAIDQSSDSEDDVRDFSAEYRRSLASKGELLLAVVDTTSTAQSESDFRSSTLSRVSLTDSETGETATRLLVTNSPTDRLTIRTNVSNAFNYFEGGFRIFEDGSEIIVGGSNSRVEEDRRSLEGSVDWVLTDKWTFRSTLGIESYKIDTRDVSSGTQTDPKGEIAILFRPQPRTTFTLSTSRSVGQLNFNQFLASSDLESEILTAGASELEPERQNDITASYDRRFGDRGVLRVSLARVETENPVNSVALSETLIVSQNTSPEITNRLQASVEYPFERFGHKDLVLSISSTFSDSETIDPITGETREVSSSGGCGNCNGNNSRNFSGGSGNFNGNFGNFGGFTPRHYKQVELRKDPGDGKWSWSVSARDVQPTGNYSTRQIRNSTGEQRWNASLTYEPRDGLKFRANVDGPRTQTRVSSFFPGVREIGLDPSYIATSTTRRGRMVSFTVEWRGERLEITGSLSSRPNSRTDESLIAFGDTTGTLLAAETARTPRAMLRFRVRN